MQEQIYFIFNKYSGMRKNKGTLTDCKNWFLRTGNMDSDSYIVLSYSEAQKQGFI